MSRHFVLAAGGTGGHLVPAHAVARELERREHTVSLITDARGASVPGVFEGNDKHIVEAASPGSNPLKWPGAYFKIRRGRKDARETIEHIEPAAVLGFGGYPVLPAMLAAVKASVPTLIHEQNAVLGRVNRMLAGRAETIATSFPDTRRLDDKYSGKVTLTGNPVRAEIAALAQAPYPHFDDLVPFRILVLGGSLGARILSEVVPAGLAKLPQPLRDRLQVMQQAREEDIEALSAAYRSAQIPADLTTYMDDVPAALERAHLFIGRAGASTVSELAAAGRPAIFVPLPIATDDHQAVNTEEMVHAGGARMMRQDRFTPDALAAQIEAMAAQPGALANAAAAARTAGRPKATERLADLAERVAGATWTSRLKSEAA